MNWTRQEEDFRCVSLGFFINEFFLLPNPWEDCVSWVLNGLLEPRVKLPNEWEVEVIL